jgi:hypothetical protein
MYMYYGVGDLPIEMNSAKRMSVCFDVQYSLLQGMRSCAARELVITIRPFVFCNSGTAKLRSRDVSVHWTTNQLVDDHAH